MKGFLALLLTLSVAMVFALPAHHHHGSDSGFNLSSFANGSGSNNPSNNSANAPGFGFNLPPNITGFGDAQQFGGLLPPGSIANGLPFALGQQGQGGNGQQRPGLPFFGNGQAGVPGGIPSFGSGQQNGGIPFFGNGQGQGGFPSFGNGQQGGNFPFFG
uniref:Uncharacterized protein n=1 Tax=Anopheles epiroticus TaxID=199890 RepID=A0A240PPX5_9DIPT